MGPELEKLLTLQEIDLKIIQLGSRFSAIPSERERIEAGFNEFSAAYNEILTNLETSRAERRKLEHDLEEVQKHHEKYKEDLMKVRNEKEYTTCLREIDSTKKEASRLETELLKLMEEIEKLEAESATYSPEVERRRRETDEELAAFDREFEEGKLEFDRIKEERGKIAKSIPKQLFAQYERVAKLRNGIALANAQNGTCSACRMKIRPQAFSEIRRGDQIIICENCSRMLYYRSEQAQQTSETAFASE